MKFGYFCSSPLAICGGVGTLVSSCAASRRIWNESTARLLAASVKPLDGAASADVITGTAADANVTAAAPGIRVRNSLLLAECSLSEAGSTSVLTPGFAIDCECFRTFSSLPIISPPKQTNQARSRQTAKLGEPDPLNSPRPFILAFVSADLGLRDRMQFPC